MTFEQKYVLRHPGNAKENTDCIFVHVFNKNDKNGQSNYKFKKHTFFSYYPDR